MNGPLLDDSLWLVSQTRGATRVARLVVFVSPLAATVCTSLAAGEAFFIGAVVVLALAAYCAVMPDTHLGLALMLLLTLEWLVRVGDSQSIWSIGLAASLGLFHLALAFSGTLPAGAHLERSLQRRWVRRIAIAVIPAVMLWFVVFALGQMSLGPQATLVATCLLTISIAAACLAAMSR